MNHTANCPNCNAQLSGLYCANCGQSTETEIALKPVLTSLIKKASELDFRFVRVVKELFVRPGAMIKDYLLGKRVIYANPFKSLFYTATIYFLVVTFLDIRITFGSQEEDAGKAVAAFINYLLFPFLALASFPFMLFYRKQQLNWAKSFVILCFTWSGYLLIVSLLAIISKLLPMMFEISRLVIAPIYLFFVLKVLFDQSWWLTLVKSVLFYLCYMLSSMLVMSGVISLAHYFQFKPLMISFGS